MDKNVVETIGCLIAHLSIPVTRTTMLRELERQPDNETLLGISEVLEKWKITNAAYQLPAGELVNDLCPFIAYMAKGIKEYEFALVTHIDPYSVTLSNENWKGHAMPRATFDRIYTGAVLLVEPEVDAGEVNYRESRRRERLQRAKTPFIIGVVALALAGFFIPGRALDAYALASLLLKCAGGAASVVLVMQSLQADSPWVKRFCVQGKYADCEDILSSKAALIAPGFTWAEAGLLYFTAGTLALLLQPGTAAVLQALAFLSLLCLPYVVYSISYQAFTAKKWCVLCTAVQILLAADFVVLLRYISWPLHPWPLHQAYGFALALLTPPAVWMLIKPLVLKAHELITARKTLLRFKGNEQLFHQALAEQPSYALPQPDCAIVLGNPQSDKIITVVSNPYCNPCAKTHKALDEWLAYTDDLQVRLILTSSVNDSEANRHLIALTKTHDHAITRQALSDWYRQRTKNYAAWARKYPVEKSVMHEEVSRVLQQQNTWCQNANVPFTPLVIVNGHQLPDAYLVEDLKYLI